MISEEMFNQFQFSKKVLNIFINMFKKKTMKQQNSSTLKKKKQTQTQHKHTNNENYKYPEVLHFGGTYWQILPLEKKKRKSKIKIYI